MSDTGIELENSAVAYPVLPTVGEQLRVAREAKGVTLAEVAQTLKLGVRQLEAVEAGNWQALPGATFIRGFVRNYARLLGVDPLPLMEQLDSLLEVKRPELALPEGMQTTMPERTGASQRRDYAFVSFGLVLVAVAVLIYFFMPDDLSRLRDSMRSVAAMFSRATPATVQPAPATAAEPVLPPGSTLNQVINPQSVQAAETPPPAPAPVTANTATPTAIPATEAEQKPVTPPTQAPLRLSFSKESWVEVRDRRGNVVFSQRGVPGAERDVDGQPPFALVIGYAPGVTVTLRGSVVDLTPHTRGDVARLTLE